MSDLGFERGDLVVITGAGSGIGQATARLAKSVGLDVAAWDLNEETARASAQEVGGTFARVDVTNEDEIVAAFQSLNRAPRFVVNNAGPPSAVPRPFNDGLSAVAGSMEAVVRAWLATEIPDGAALVNIASVAGNVIGSVPDWYCAGKSAVTGYTRHLAFQHPKRFRSNAVLPGMVATPRSAGFADSPALRAALKRNPLNRMATPEEIGWAILFLLSPRASYINGAELVVDGGWTIAP